MSVIYPLVSLDHLNQSVIVSFAFLIDLLPGLSGSREHVNNAKVNDVRGDRYQYYQRKLKMTWTTLLYGQYGTVLFPRGLALYHIYYVDVST